MKLASASPFALSLMAAPAIAQEENGFGDWDADESGVIDEEEWGTGFGETGAFGEWDEDDDQMLNADEFAGAPSACTMPTRAAISTRRSSARSRTARVRHGGVSMG